MKRKSYSKELIIQTGNIKISVFFQNAIGIDMEYFVPRFKKKLAKGEIVEYTDFGLAFDCYLILEYDSLDDLIQYIHKDLKGIQSVMNRNKGHFLPKSDKNEKMLINTVCTIGQICDNWLSKESHNG